MSKLYLMYLILFIQIKFSQHNFLGNCAYYVISAYLNKRPIGHIAHLRKQFKSINTFDYIITLIKRRKKNHYYLYEHLLVLHLKKLESPSPKDAFCQVWLKLAQWFWRKRFLNFVNVFYLFYNYLSLEQVRALHFNNL